MRVTLGDAEVLRIANDRLRDAIEWYTDVVPEYDVAELRDALTRFESLHERWTRVCEDVL